MTPLLRATRHGLAGVLNSMDTTNGQYCHRATTTRDCALNHEWRESMGQWTAYHRTPVSAWVAAAMARSLPASDKTNRF